MAAIFATIGDGVEVDADGIRKLVVDYGHTAVWVLLALALLLAAVSGRWGRASGVLASIALALYLLFLFAVFLWP